MGSVKLVWKTLAAAIHEACAAAALAPKFALKAAVNVGTMVSASLGRGATMSAAVPMNARTRRPAALLRTILKRLVGSVLIFSPGHNGPSGDAASRERTTGA